MRSSKKERASKRSSSKEELLGRAPRSQNDPAASSKCSEHSPKNKSQLTAACQDDREVDAKLIDKRLSTGVCWKCLNWSRYWSIGNLSIGLLVGLLEISIGNSILESPPQSVLRPVSSVEHLLVDVPFSREHLLVESLLVESFRELSNRSRSSCVARVFRLNLSLEPFI